MALCAYHEDTESVITCVACHSPICAKCRDFGADGMCGMCLEMASARQASGAREPKAPSSSSSQAASPRPGKPSAKPDKALKKNANSANRPTSKTPAPAETKRSASSKRGTGKLTDASPRGNEQRPQRSKLPLAALLVVLVTGALLALFFGGGTNEEIVQQEAEIQEYMGRVKTAILAVQDQTGKLPENLGDIEDYLRRGGVDLELLRPPIYLVMDRSSKQPNTIVLTTVSDGIEIRGLNAKGKEISYDNRPIVLTARKKESTGISPKPFTYERSRPTDTDDASP